MSNGTIKSSIIAAEDAINELVGIKTYSMDNKKVEFGYTEDINGMSIAKNTVNGMLDLMSDLSVAVLAQSNKFPALASSIEKRDIEASEIWGRDNECDTK